ncbi:MAG: flippase-like domain-containing protein [Candidatus Marinimicrobia bacterium]|jgi:hypothetical protein|nr:flippase-like domain-containing protein [Candidatus Neomarinimicrobiota bacterium]MBT3633469.1 flippase-like domain-containing protein [Candidatus Neomarinimicrobiota bacterium]MBT3681612.1 flippase-like domain-containing protein [Candidatus Neomarinimicrobiota bacterium]MBT3758421.1 flippase-like domain-containing protein [Candidatus Neomarinimicrobiota bacterium]MBT3894925.1 flippase-like domain-containing protein [Candidatus Neomarinimicrobiota bacterium]
MKEKASIKSVSFTIIRILIVFSIVLYLLNTNAIDLSRISEMVFSTWVIPAFACYLIVICISIIRWNVLLNAMTIYPGILSITKLSFIGFAFSMIIPGGVGGDIVKAYYVAKGIKDLRTAAITTIGLDRLIGLFSMFFTGSLAMISMYLFRPELINSDHVTIFKSIAVIISGGTISILIIFLTAMNKYLKKTKLLNWLTTQGPGHVIFSKVYDTIHSFRKKKKSLLITFLLSMLSQGAFVFTLFFIGLSANESNIQIQHYFFLTPISLIMNAVPISPGGIGSGELFADWLFRSFGSSNGSEIMVILHLAFIVVSLFGFMVYIQGKNEFSDIESEIRAE